MKDFSIGLIKFHKIFNIFNGRVHFVVLRMPITKRSNGQAIYSFSSSAPISPEDSCPSLDPYIEEKDSATPLKEIQIKKPTNMITR